MCPTCSDVILTRHIVLDETYMLVWQGCQCSVMNLYVKKRVNV